MQHITAFPELAVRRDSRWRTLWCESPHLNPVAACMIWIEPMRISFFADSPQPHLLHLLWYRYCTYNILIDPVLVSLIQ